MIFFFFLCGRSVKQATPIIDLPAKNSNSETIVITGKRANCEAARHRITSLWKDLQKMFMWLSNRLKPWSRNW